MLLPNRCRINCGSKVTANKRMVVESTCEGLSCRAIQRYNWTLYMIDPWAENITWEQVTDLEDRILTNVDSPSLVFIGMI